MPSSSTIIAREIRTIKSSFNRLAKSFEKIAPLLAATTAAAHAANGKSERRKPRLSARQRQALKLQGQYMGTMRGLPPAKRAKVKKVRTTKGIRAAIAEARRLTRS